ncbi:metal ABC transporter solute-binding protein, Zn/Mn family [Miniphocaeibacter halophilus]|uniref:Zinc ABC transporter substrate-binding protein n=1 Tax=Miniphocaeibacter halophilus TaxID=2931922 RepID=A0AC61N4G9_9FIRM|nr:zinc ABC transporter substrate-binding protein [Miniphocaeibacter halophilus]QQK07973.1 zinc ABC transporter substrate-binding protein [Miniphocaeibacter halophilus]
MKRKILLILLLSLVLVSCTNKNNDNEKNIYTSIYPIEYLTKEIVGNKYKVINIIPEGAEIHGWEPSMKTVASMSDSQLILVNGLGLESWADSVSESVGEDKIVEVNKGIDYIKLTEGEKDNHGHGDYDPHIWLSIKNMIVMAKNIEEEVVKLDPENKSYYRENLERLETNLKELDNKFKSSLEEYKGKAIIVPHDAFGYLVRDYNLKQIPIEGINSSSEPDLGTVAKIVDVAKNNNINTVFYEYGGSEKIAKTIAKEIDGKIKEIYSLENITEELIKNKDNYYTLMEKNLNNILESFK